MSDSGNGTPPSCDITGQIPDPVGGGRMPSRFLKDTGWSLVKLEDERKAQSVLDDATRFAPELQKWRAPRIEVSQRFLPFYPDYVFTLLQDP